MRPTIAARQEVVRLAATLGCEMSELEFLEDLVDAHAIAGLRSAVMGALGRHGSDRISRVAAAGRLLPAPLAATITETAISPALCAIIASNSDVSKLADVAKRLDLSFVAKVATHLDPSRVSDLIDTMPVSRLVEVAQLLAADEQYPTMAMFVDVLVPSTLHTLVAHLTPLQILRTSALVTSPSAIDEVLSALSDEAVVSLLEEIHHEDLWFEALAILDKLHAGGRGRLGDIALSRCPEVVNRLCSFATQHQMWTPLLATLGDVAPENRPAVAKLAVLNQITALRSIVAEVVATQRWEALVEVVGMCSVGTQRKALAVLAALDDDELVRLTRSLPKATWSDFVARVDQLDSTLAKRLTSAPGGTRRKSSPR